MDTASQTENIQRKAETYLAPWRERNKDGTLGPEYGPPSPAAQARLDTKFKNWAWRSDIATPAKRVMTDDEMTAAYLYLLGSDQPLKREREVFNYIAQGHSVRWIGRHLGIRRESVKQYIKRLKARVTP